MCCFRETKDTTASFRSDNANDKTRLFTSQNSQLGQDASEQHAARSCHSEILSTELAAAPQDSTHHDTATHIDMTDSICSSGDDTGWDEVEQGKPSALGRGDDDAGTSCDDQCITATDDKGDGCEMPSSKAFGPATVLNSELSDTPR